MLITLYARKEPTLDQVAKQFGLRKFDVVFYKDRACTERYATWSWHYNPPRKSAKTIVLNCWRWAVTWLEDMAPASSTSPI